MESVVNEKLSAREITNLLIEACDDLYGGNPGDDTTVVSLKVIKPKWATLFAGPPQNKEQDQEVVKALMESVGKKLCVEEQPLILSLVRLAKR